MTHPETSSRKFLQWATPLLLIIPALCFATFVWAYAADVPWFDDIESFAGFLLQYRGASTGAEKIHLLLKPNNEHRILFAKLTTLLVYALNGTLNFRWFIGIAFLCLLGIVGVLYRLFQSFRVPLLWFLPVTLLLLQPQFYLTSIWAITGLQHQAVVFLLMTSLYLLASGSSRRFGLAFLPQLLASFSMSNGLFGWVAGAAVLLLQRKFGRLAIWLLVGVVVIWFYFHDYASPQGNETSFSYFWQHPHIVFLAFFTFVGGLLDFFPNTNIVQRSILPTLAGFLLFGLVFWRLIRLLQTELGTSSRFSQPGGRARYFFFGCYALLFVNAVVIAFLRPRFGYDVMLVSNYTIYPALLTAVLYLNGISQVRANQGQYRWATAGLLVGGLLWGLSYFRYWPRVAERKQVIESFAFNQKYNGIGLGATLGTAYADTARRMMDGAVQVGIYQYPQTGYTPYETRLLQPFAEASIDPALRFTVTPTPDGYTVESPEWMLPDSIRKVYLILKSDQRTYLFTSKSPYVPSRFYGSSKTVEGVRSLALKASLYPGTYRLGVLTLPGGAEPIRYSSQRLVVP